MSAYFRFPQIFLDPVDGLGDGMAFAPAGGFCFDLPILYCLQHVHPTVIAIHYLISVRSRKFGLGQMINLEKANLNNLETIQIIFCNHRVFSLFPKTALPVSHFSLFLKSKALPARNFCATLTQVYILHGDLTFFPIAKIRP